MKTIRRKTSAIAKEEEHETEAATKYSRLVTMSAKRIRKECKIIKSFECQKVVRKIKAIKDDSNVDDTVMISSTAAIKGESFSAKHIPDTATTLKTTVKSLTTTIDDEETCEMLKNNRVQGKILKLEEQLRRTKDFDIDEGVIVCLTRLGLKQKPLQQGVNMKTDQQRLKGKANIISNDSEHNDDNSDGGVGGNLPSHHSLKNKGEGYDVNNNERKADTEEVECHVDSKKNDYQRKKEKFNLLFVELMLRHKRIISVIKSINEKIAEHSAWLSQREEWLRGLHKNNKREGVDDDNSKNFSKRTKYNSKAGDRTRRGEEVDVLGHGGNSGLFIDSLAGNIGSNVEGGNFRDISGDHLHQRGGDYEYNDYDHEDQLDIPTLQNKKKKNRQGQRARKAKAMAIEARKAGHVWDSSVNWRKSKASTHEENEEQGKTRKYDDKRGNRVKSNSYNSLTKKSVSASGLDKSKNVNVSDIAMMEGKNWKEDGNAHPSWAAREAQKKQSSVQFTGTKIIFD